MFNPRRFFAAAVISAAAISFGPTAQAALVITNVGDLTTTNPNTFPNEAKIFLDTFSGTAGVGHVGSQTGDPGTPQINFLANIAVDYKSGTASVDEQNGTRVPSSLIKLYQSVLPRAGPSMT